MKHILSFCLLLNISFALEVNITADKFFASENKQKAEFSGHVKVTKANDELLADKLHVSFDNNHKPIIYEAIGNANLKLILKGKKYSAKAKYMSYHPENEIYTLKENAFLKDLDMQRIIQGDHIQIDQKNGIYKVKGKENQPVSFTFELKDSVKLEVKDD